MCPLPHRTPSETTAPEFAHPGADECAVCAAPRNGANWGWTSSRTVWCPGCKHAYEKYRSDHPIPTNANGLATHMPAYMYPPAEWARIGFNPADLNQYRYPR